jgi:hypothetical protein
MGLFYSKLSDEQREILRHCVGLKAEEIQTLFNTIPVHTYKERSQYQKHVVPNTIAFLLLRGEYIVNAKSVFGGKVTHHC